MEWKTHKAQLLQNPRVKHELQAHELEYQVARHLLKARLELNLTQVQLAQKLETRQSVISRVESGKSLPSLSFLQKLAKALNLTLDIRFHSNA